MQLLFSVCMIYKLFPDTVSLLPLLTDPIDLTKEGNDQDMQKALMLSMQDLPATGGGVLSLEEQELSRSVGGAGEQWVGVSGWGLRVGH